MLAGAAELAKQAAGIRSQSDRRSSTQNGLLNHADCFYTLENCPTKPAAVNTDSFSGSIIFTR